MKIIFNIILSIIYIVVSIGLIIITPIPSIIDQENLTKTLNELKIYDQIVKVTVNGIFNNSVAKQDNIFFDEIIKKHATQIITKKWIETTGNLVIYHFFIPIQTGENFNNFDIDISELKSNFLFFLYQSDVSEFTDKIATQIPDKLNIAELLQIDVQIISNFLTLIHRILETLKLAIIVLTILIIFIIIAFFGIQSIKSTLIWLGTNSLFIGLLFVIFPLVFKYLILSNLGLSLLTHNFISMKQTLFIFITLSFIEKLSFWWSWLGLGFFTFGLLSIVLQVKMKRK